jgi:photosystem II stability/assembly factor-like uncharacterized protein
LSGVSRVLVAGLTAFLLAPSWTPQSSGVTVRLRGVSAVSDRVAWASGAGNTILRTQDGGATWTKVANPSSAPAERLDFRDVDAVSATTAYVLSIGPGTLSRIYKTTDAGLTWTMQFANAEAEAFFDAMAFWDADHGIAVSDSVKDAFVIITTEDGGKSWNRVPADGLPAALANEGAFAASGTNVTVFGTSQAWFGTGAAARARVLHTPDRGRTWTIAETPLRAGQTSGIYSIAFRDAMNGVVVGGDYSKETEATDNAAVTKDGGKTWTLVKGLSGFRSVVAYVPGQKTTVLAVGPQGSDVSADDGQTWTKVEGPGFDTFSFVRGAAIGWGAGARGTIGLFRY